MHDNQREVDVLILEGNFTHASSCNVLGMMTLTNIAPAPKGELAQQHAWQHMHSLAVAATV